MRYKNLFIKDKKDNNNKNVINSGEPSNSTADFVFKFNSNFEQNPNSNSNSNPNSNPNSNLNTNINEKDEKSHKSNVDVTSETETFVRSQNDKTNHSLLIEKVKKDQTKKTTDNNDKLTNKKINEQIKKLENESQNKIFLNANLPSTEKEEIKLQNRFNIFSGLDNNKEEIKKLKKIIKSQENENRISEKRIDSLLSKQADLKLCISDLESQLDIKKSKINHFKEVGEKLENKLKEKEKESEEKSNEIEEIKKKLNKLENEKQKEIEFDNKKVNEKTNKKSDVKCKLIPETEFNEFKQKMNDKEEEMSLTIIKQKSIISKYESEKNELVEAIEQINFGLEEDVVLDKLEQKYELIKIKKKFSPTLMDFIGFVNTAHKNSIDSARKKISSDCDKKIKEYEIKIALIENEENELRQLKNTKTKIMELGKVLSMEFKYKASWHRLVLTSFVRSFIKSGREILESLSKDEKFVANKVQSTIIDLIDKFLDLAHHLTNK